MLTTITVLTKPMESQRRDLILRETRDILLKDVSFESNLKGCQNFAKQVMYEYEALCVEAPRCGRMLLLI